MCDGNVFVVMLGWNGMWIVCGMRVEWVTCVAVENPNFFPALPPLSLLQKVYTTYRFFRHYFVCKFMLC